MPRSAVAAICLMIAVSCAGEAGTTTTPSTPSTTTSATITTTPTTTSQPTTTTSEATNLDPEEMFLAFILSASYSEGGTIQGIPVRDIDEADLIGEGMSWCSIVEVIRVRSGTDVQATAARFEALADRIIEVPASDTEVAINIYAAAEAFLCP